VNPITGEQEQEISVKPQPILSKAADQIDETLLSGALRNRASDIHLEPMPDGLRVRYRIDAFCDRLPPADLSRRVVVAPQSRLRWTSLRRPQDGLEKKYASGEHAELGMDMRQYPSCVNGRK